MRFRRPRHNLSMHALAAFTVVACTSCETFRSAEFRADTRTYHNYIDNYTFIVPDGFEFVDKHTLHDKLQGIGNAEHVLRKTEHNTILAISRKPMTAGMQGYLKKLNMSVDETGETPKFSDDFARLYERQNGRFLKTYENFLIFKRDPLPNSAVDVYNAHQPYHVSHGDRESTLFSVLMVCESYPTSVLDLHKFLYDIHLSAYTNDERVVNK